MGNDLFRFEDSYRRPRAKTNLFAWTVVILLLIGFAFAAWLGSYYIFGQPERPDSYRILKKLNKIDPPKRFQLTAAPAGEFLNAKQIYDRYNALRPAELALANAELARNYVRNFQHVRGLVPYVVGRFDVLEAHELTASDLFISGVVALTRALDRGELLMEHVYPSDGQYGPLMTQTLVPGLEIKLERSHDLSAIIHAERLADGRLLITAIPLLYGRYAVTRGSGTFSLEPPNDLNLAAGWPIFKDRMRRKAEIHYNTYRSQLASAAGSATPGSGPMALPTPPQNELIRVETALPVDGSKLAMASPSRAAQPPEPISTPKANGKRKKGGPSPIPTASPAPPVIAQQTPVRTPIPMTSATVVAQLKQTPIPAIASTAVAQTKPPPTPAPSSPPVTTAAPVIAAASPIPSPDTPTVLPAIPLTPEEAAENALASTEGGGDWKTFEPGRMPAGRLVATSELKDVADRGLAGERYYLRGQFVVNFVDANRAVLRPRTRLTDSVLHFGGGSKSTRIIVEFPAGYTPPVQGSVVSRDEMRPYEITDIRKQTDGQLNVFVREIIQR